ncbi:MAG: DUF3078 domain-containing protein [Myxococcota bacterium]
MRKLNIVGGAATLLVCTSTTALAQDATAELGPQAEYTVDGEDLMAEGDEDERPDGLSWRLNSGATFLLQDNRNVVGQQSGTSATIGFKLDGGLDYLSGDHEWRNTLAVAAGVTRTPAIDVWVKSQDNLDLDSIYLYHIYEWFGAFARVAYNTTMFRGVDIQAAPVDYLFPNGAVVNQAQLSLTDPFLPSRFKESLGLFAQPLKRERISVEARLGGGARQTIADGQLAIADDDATPELDVQVLSDVLQVGGEAGLEVWGSFDEKRVNYRLSAEAMIPFVNNAEAVTLADGTVEDPSAIDLTNVALRAILSVKIVEWASLDYELAAVREPQLVDLWQVRNNLLLSFGLSTGSAPPEEAAAE